MAALRVAPYGSWQSPITSDLIVAATVGLDQVALDGTDTYWVESRPTEGGRNVVVRRASDGHTADVTPPPFNVRTRVHEYGGGAFTVYDGTIYFSNFADQRLYRQRPGSDPEPVTPAGDVRYADGVVDRARRRLICVREDHTGAGREAVNSLVCVDLEDGVSTVLASGRDFYSSPRLDATGSRAAWLCWDHPNMPWDGTELWVGNVGADGTLEGIERVAGGTDESIFQPEWSPDGVLHFVSDRTGWWNLYRLRAGRAEPLCEMAAEFGTPQWAFGNRTYGFASAGTILCAYSQEGTWRLAKLGVATGALEAIPSPYTELGHLRVVDGRAVFVAGSPLASRVIIQLDLSSSRVDVLKRSSQAVVDAGYLSTPESVAFPTEQGRTAHALYYAPRNQDYADPAGELPPLIVRCHGGPTSAASSTLSLRIQYWTSRGFGVLDVNYGGSTGYGRDYRRRLDGQWGVVDVDDCVNGAHAMVERGLVDGNRLTISGGSAGGYTVLCALTFRDDFRAGASHYGISDLEALARDTHKFESRYLDRLIGPYPERRDLYVARSPIYAAERLSCPVIFFQGLEDRVVPPSQAELMVNALRAKGVPVAYLTFAGEQHGFRRAENVKRSLDAELSFYAQVFGFPLAGEAEPVPIENL